MVDFSDREDIRRWLDAINPAKRRREVAVAMAARASLRVTPRLRLSLEESRSRATVLSDWMLPSLRATALAWAAAKYPARGSELRGYAVAAADAARVAAAAADEAYPYARDSYAAIDASNAAAYAADSAAHPAAVARADEAADVRLGPQDREAARKIAALAAPIARAANEPESPATPAAQETLAEQVSAAIDAPNDINGDQAAELARKTAGNFVGELLRRAYAPIRGFGDRVKNEGKFAQREFRAGLYRAPGTAAFGGLSFVAMPIGRRFRHSSPAMLMRLGPSSLRCITIPNSSRLSI
jgi:hypothetical protein